MASRIPRVRQIHLFALELQGGRSGFSAYGVLLTPECDTSSGNSRGPTSRPIDPRVPKLAEAPAAWPLRILYRKTRNPLAAMYIENHTCGCHSRRKQRRPHHRRDLRRRRYLLRTTSDRPYTSRNTSATCAACHCSISTSREENRRSSTASGWIAVSTRSTRCSWL